MSVLPTIVCVLKTGGGVYGPEWVHALRMGLLGATSVRYDFRCLSDDPRVGLWRDPLEHGWPGWWSKVEVFRPGRFQGRVLYLDLDTLVVGDVAPLLQYEGRAAFLEDFYQGRGMIASGVVTWTGDELAHVYKAFTQSPGPIMAAHRNRSDHWYRKVAGEVGLIQEVAPGLAVSLKAHAKHGPPDGAALVCGHGRPRFSDPKAGWAHEQWRRLT